MKQSRLQNLFIALAPILIPAVFATSLFAQQTGARPSAAAGAGRSATPSRGSTTSSSSSYGSNTRQYRSNTMLGDALIQIDPETRSLVVVADEDTHADIMKVINNLDRPKPQVLIKVVFVEVNLDKGLNLGVEGSYTFKAGNPLAGTTTGTSGATTSALGGSTTSTTTQNIPTSGGNTQLITSGSSPALPIIGGLIPQTGSLQSIFGLASQGSGSFVRILNDNWQATLYALASRGNLNILSRPSIMARNNQQAVIVVGQEVPFVTNSTITAAGQVNNSVQYQDVGIILRVTPFITSNRNVEMIVAPEISSISATTVQISPNVNSPVIDKRSAETVVVTPDATTLVIGGLMQKQQTEQLQKIPILGDIPILGFPFRHVVKSTSRSELLIFLTPYIVETTQKIKDITLDEANRAEMSQEAFTPADIRKHLDTMELKTDPGSKKATYHEVRRATPANNTPDEN